LFGMNIGGPGTTIFMIFAGVAGSGLLSLFIEGQLGNQDVTIMNFLCTLYSIFYCDIKYRCNMRRYYLSDGLQIKNITSFFKNNIFWISHSPRLLEYN
jgi:hypothetical protein